MKSAPASILILSAVRSASRTGLRGVSQGSRRRRAEIGMAGLQKRDEVAGVAEAVFVGRERGLALGRIAAKRHDIAETTGINAIGDLGEFGARVTHTREVRHDGEVKVAFQKVTDLCSAVASRAAGSVGHGYEIGAMRFSAVAVARTASTPVSSLGGKIPATEADGAARRVRRWDGRAALHINGYGSVDMCKASSFLGRQNGREA